MKRKRKRGRELRRELKRQGGKGKVSLTRRKATKE
jgi:hypothetical protein